MIFWSCLAIVCVCLALEKVRLKRWLAAIPVRVHVYGTRGKTTTARALYGALSASGHAVLGKTTGDSPLILLPGGAERRLRRIGPASVREYLRCLQTAAVHRCDAVVFECMAVSPESIAAASAMLSPTHLVVTNTRPDHHETMGDTPSAITATLALSVPPACTVFATEDAGVAPVRDRARTLGNAFHGIPEKDQPPLLQSRELVLAMARTLDQTPPALEPATAFWPGFRRHALPDGGGFRFLDLFSANDVASSAMLLEKALSGEQDADFTGRPLVALLATRPDRPLRTRAFVEWFGTPRCRAVFSGYVALGWHAPYARLALNRQSPALPCVLPVTPMPSPAGLLRRLRARFGDGFGLVGLGNAHGYGERFRAFLEKRE
jgi:hypothetical protein